MMSQLKSDTVVETKWFLLQLKNFPISEETLAQSVNVTEVSTDLEILIVNLELLIAP